MSLYIHKGMGGTKATKQRPIVTISSLYHKVSVLHVCKSNQKQLTCKKGAGPPTGGVQLGHFAPGPSLKGPQEAP